MTQETRTNVYNKYNGHCAYCGKVIEYKDMQVDHIIPKAFFHNYNKPYKCDDIVNLFPSCRRCNHYKRSYRLEDFRQLLKTLPARLSKIYIFNVAVDYGIIEKTFWDGTFYFERVKQ